jgi:hypothetical protein
MTHIKHFESIEELPAYRWHDLNLALMIEAGAGNGIDGLENLLITAFRHNEAKEHDKASVCIVNAIQNIALAKAKQSMIPQAFAATVKEVAGKDVSGMQTEDVRAMLDRKTPIAKLFAFVEQKKNSLTRNLRSFFLK